MFSHYRRKPTMTPGAFHPRQPEFGFCASTCEIPGYRFLLVNRLACGNAGADNSNEKDPLCASAQSGTCGPQGGDSAGASSLAWWATAPTALLTAPAWGAFELPADELERWRRELFAPAKPRVYLRTGTPTRACMGGIGTGNFSSALTASLRRGSFSIRFATARCRFIRRQGGPDHPVAAGRRRPGVAARQADRNDRRLPRWRNPPL